MDLSFQWLSGTDAKWNDNEKQWTFPSGATINFGYLDSEVDKFRYQGSNFDFVGFDELTQFSETQYLYLFSRIRQDVASDLPIRIRAGSNPGGIGHEWVKTRFVSSGNIRGQVFIPASLYDNPHLNISAYEAALDRLDPVTREQLMNGNWDVVGSGNFFQASKFKIVDEAPRHGQYVRYWDMAATEYKEGIDPDYTVGAKMMFLNGQYWLVDIVMGRWNPVGAEEVVRKTAEQDGPNVAIYMEQEPGSSGVNVISHYSRNVLCGYNFHGIKTTGNKVNRAKPFSAAVDNGNVSLLKAHWNKRFIDECVVFPQKGFHDDQVDAASGAFEMLSSKGPTVVKTAKVNRAENTVRKMLEGY